MGLALAAPPPAAAQAREEGAPAEVLGVGDNVRASVWGPAALYFNPAGLSRARALIVQAGYTYLDGRDAHGFGVAAVDGMTNPYVAMGVGYSFITSAPGGVDRDGHQLRAGISTGYSTGDVALYAGVGLRYLTLSIGDDERDDVDAWTVDTGLILDVAQRIRFGVVGANLIETDTGEAPRKLGLGLGLLFESLEITADMEVDLTGRAEVDVLRYGFGAQYGFAGAFNARLGLVVDQLLTEERITAGFGYASQEFAVDLGYSSALTDEAAMVFSVSFRYTPPMQPVGR